MKSLFVSYWFVAAYKEEDLSKPVPWLFGNIVLNIDDSYQTAEITDAEDIKFIQEEIKKEITPHLDEDKFIKNLVLINFKWLKN